MQGISARLRVEPGAFVGGRYRVRGLLGSGGMADVYDATDERLERPVALKVLRPEMAVRDDIRLRFQVEARAAAGLSHPNAVAVFDTGEHEGMPYLVMERLPGDTLADCLPEGPVDTAWLCEAATGVLGALAAAHAAGIVHRDVKPGNILITADGRAKITDFGIAKSLGTGSDASDLTRTGQLVGTPAYVAPERLEGHPATPQSDLFALGVVLYEALAGSKPFQGNSPIAVARAVVDGDYVPLAAVRPDLDPRLVAVVERAMARNPEDRFAAADEMAAALAAPTVDPTLDAFPVGTALLATDQIAARGRMPSRPAAPDYAKPDYARRRRLTALAAVGLVLLFLFALARPHPSPGQHAPARSVDTSAPSAATAPAQPAQPGTTAVAEPPSASASVTVTVPSAGGASVSVSAGDASVSVSADSGGKGGGGGKGKGKGGKG